jgi:hypothetical protein
MYRAAALNQEIRGKMSIKQRGCKRNKERKRIKD